MVAAGANGKAKSQGSTVREAGVHAIIVTLGGGIWGFFGAVGLDGRYGLVPQIIDVFIVLLLVAAGWMLVQAARHLPQEGQTRFQARFRTYLQVVRIEYVAIAAAVILGNVIHQQIWIMPVIALIVGIHFFALVNILQRVPALVKGALLCLTIIITVALLPATVRFNGGEVVLWAFVPGIACAMVLWVDAVMALGRGYSLRARTEALA